MSEIIHPEESYRVLGACFEVYKEKGCGFLEAVFHECLEIEFGNRTVSYFSHPVLTLKYKGQQLRQTYSPDFICEGTIVLGIKAVSKLCDEHRAQVHNYFRATGHRPGMLVNFGHHPKLEHERIVI